MENEKILGIYQLELGEGTYKLFDVFFTNQRLIGSYIESRFFYTKFRGLPGCIGAIMWPQRFADYAIIVPLTRRKGPRPSTNPDEILKSDKRNFAWNYYQDIKTIEFNKKAIIGGQHYINIELSDGKKKIFGYNREQRDELLKLFQEVMQGNVVVKRI